MSNDIKILHSSCCSKGSPIREQIEKIAAVNGLQVSIEELSELKDTMAFGTMSFPSIIVNGKAYDYKKHSSDDKLAALLG